VRDDREGSTNNNNIITPSLTNMFMKSLMIETIAQQVEILCSILPVFETIKYGK
jgi:hypothetical protein